MANDRSKNFFNVLALENILVALTREIGDGPCFLYIEFSWIGVESLDSFGDFNMVDIIHKSEKSLSVLNLDSEFTIGFVCFLMAVISK